MNSYLRIQQSIFNFFRMSNILHIRLRAAGTYFNKVRTDPLEMQPLASSDPLLLPTNLPPYVVYHSEFNAITRPHLNSCYVTCAILIPSNKIAYRLR